MAYSDEVAQVANGEDTGAGSNWDYSLPGALARLTKRNPLAGSLIARAARSTKPTAQPGTSDVAGAGKDSSGPNGPGMSSPHLAAQPLNVRPRADYASGNPDDFQPYDPEAPTLDSKPASFPRDIAQAPPDQQASLAPQGGSNKLVRALARLSGQAAKSPAPDQPYVGPGSGFTVDGDNGNIRKQSYAERTSQPSPLALLGRALQQVGASMGTPQQKLWAAEQPQQEQEMNLRLQMAQNEANYRRGMLGYHDRANDISEAKAQTAQTKTLGDLRAKGYKVDEGGNVAPMSEDEILADPVASRN